MRERPARLLSGNEGGEARATRASPHLESAYWNEPPIRICCEVATSGNAL
jgi:hypothetical protein